MVGAFQHLDRIHLHETQLLDAALQSGGSRSPGSRPAQALAGQKQTPSLVQADALHINPGWAGSPRLEDLFFAQRADAIPVVAQHVHQHFLGMLA